jgi:methionyl-tRNA formyltransferase
MNILLVAEEAAGIMALRALARTEHRLVAALTAEPTRGGGSTVAAAAAALGIPVLPSARVREAETADWVRAQEIDLLLNVHSLYVVHPEVLHGPRIGSFNLHPGPLPEYAGLNAPSWAIYHGESEHAVTVHWMAPEIDAGPIAYATSFAIAEEDTGLTLSARCAREGVPLLLRLVEQAAANPAAIPRRPQDLTRRRYFGREAPNGGRLSWRWPAREVVNFVRASDYLPFPSPWGHPRARWRGQDLYILKAALTGQPADRPAGTVGGLGGGAATVAAGDEWLRIERVRLDDEPAAAAGELLVRGDVLEDGR